MRHAGPDALDQAESLLAQIRSVPGLTERKRGVFYRGSKAFAHFHEDPSGLHADVRLADDFERMRVETRAERAEFVRQVKAALALARGRAPLPPRG